MNSECLKTVERYDPRSNRWTQLADLNEGRANMCVIVLNGCILVMGGKTGRGTYTNSVEKYVPAANKWILQESMLVPVGYASVCQIELARSSKSYRRRRRKLLQETHQH